MVCRMTEEEDCGLSHHCCLQVSSWVELTGRKGPSPAAQQAAASGLLRPTREREPFQSTGNQGVHLCMRTSQRRSSQRSTYILPQGSGRVYNEIPVSSEPSASSIQLWL